MNEKVEIYKGDEYIDNNPTWHEEDSPWKASNIIKMLHKNKITLNSVAEIGCGAGEIINQLHQKLPSNVQFKGYDIAPRAIELCSGKEKERLSFVLEDLLKDGNKDFFDLVLCIDIFEHVEDSFTFLRKLKTKGKYKIFHIPLALSASAVLRNTPLIESRKTVGHIHYYNKDIALALLKDTDYEIVDYFYTAGSLDLPAKKLRTKVARLPRKIMYSINPDFTVRLMGGFSLMVLAK